MENSELLTLYGKAQDDVVALAGTLSPGQTATPVPACPGWSVQDVVAHLAGIVGDIVVDNVAEVGTDPWTNAQVEARRGLPLAQVIEEWQSATPEMIRIVEPWPDFLVNALLGDIITHEQDIRGAIGQPGGRSSMAFAAAVDGYVAELGPRLEGDKAPAVQIVTADSKWIAGGDDPAATVRLTPFELIRSLTGRRSPAQVRAYNWDGNADPYLAVWSQYGDLSSTDVTES